MHKVIGRTIGCIDNLINSVSVLGLALAAQGVLVSSHYKSCGINMVLIAVKK